MQQQLADEWTVSLYRDGSGEVLVALYEQTPDGQGSHIDSERFPTTATATDVTQWIVRHWAPRAHLRLR